MEALRIMVANGAFADEVPPPESHMVDTVLGFGVAFLWLVGVLAVLILLVFLPRLLMGSRRGATRSV